MKGQQLKNVLEAGRHAGNLGVVDRVAEPLDEIEVAGRRSRQALADLVDTLRLGDGIDFEQVGGRGDTRCPLAADTNLNRVMNY